VLLESRARELYFPTLAFESTVWSHQLLFLVRRDKILFDPEDVIVEVSTEAESSLKVERMLEKTIIARMLMIRTAVKWWVFLFILVTSKTYYKVTMKLSIFIFSFQFIQYCPFVRTDARFIDVFVLKDLIVHPESSRFPCRYSL